MDEQEKMKGAKKWWVLGGLVVVLIIFTLAYTNSTKAPEGGYKIGAILSETGNNAAYGESTRRGMEVALEQLTRNGKKLKIIFEDDATKVDNSVSIFNRMVSIEKTPIVLGFISSNAILAVAPVANDNKVVALSTLAGADDIKDAGDYVFRIREKTATHGDMMANLAISSLGYKKVALYFANAANSISYADAFRKKVVSLGGEIVFDGSFTEKSTDFRSDLAKIKKTNPDAVYIAGVAPDMAQIILQANSIGLKTNWLASSGAESPKLTEIAKEKAEGLIFTTPAFNPEQGSDVVKNFVSAFKQKYNELPNFAAANGYDGVMLVYQIIEKYGYDAEKIKKGLYDTKNYVGAGGAFSFDEFGEVQKEIIFKIVKDGQFVVYKK